MDRNQRWARPLSLFLLVVFTMPASSGARDSRCRRVSFDFAPTMVYSASWSPGEKGLAMVDVGDNAVLEVSLEGKLERRVRAFSHPGYIHAWKDGYMLFDLPPRFLELDASFRPRSAGAKPLQLPLPTAAGELEYAVGMQVANNSKEVLSLGVLRQGDQRSLGVVRVVFDPPGATAGVRVEGGPMETQFYTMGLPFLAVLDGHSYLVRVGERLQIVELGPTPRALTAFPTGFDRLPLLPSVEGAAGADAQFKAIEKATMFSGLFAGERGLYVLTRKPAAVGTNWQLTEIDPVKDAVVNTFDLPTRASHLVVVPGKTSWAILEKGPRSTYGQAMQGALLIPASWIREKSSPLRQGTVTCEGSGAP